MFMIGMSTAMTVAGGRTDKRSQEGNMLEEFKNNAVWLMAGIAVGTLVGVFLAPKSGRETRDEIATGVNHATNT